MIQYSLVSKDTAHRLEDKGLMPDRCRNFPADCGLMSCDAV
jgi:hypothetical protein